MPKTAIVIALAGFVLAAVGSTGATARRRCWRDRWSRMHCRWCWRDRWGRVICR